MNEADSRALAASLELRGYQATDNPAEADWVILNTCVVRHSAEQRALSRLQTLAELKKRRPAMRIALMGCLVGVRPSPDLARRFPFVDVFLPPSDTTRLLQRLDLERGAFDPTEENTSTCHRMASTPPPAPVVYIPAVLGCSHACTYCIIPYRRGAERSRPRADILRDVRVAAERGAREVMLLGQIVDRYGADRPGEGDLADLLRDTAQTPGIVRIRFLTSHPSYLNDRIIRAVAESPKICPVFELPIQAGNNEVLAAMRRGYTREAYLAMLDRIRSLVPHAAIHTDIIVGFPGETEAQFQDTVEIVRRAAFAKVHLAMYSPRPQTYAARHLPDDVPPEEKKRRHRLLEELQKDIQARRNAALKGQCVDVLVDGRDEKRGRWQGRTVDDRLVFFTSSRARPGDLISVRIEWTGPFTLIGADAVETEKQSGGLSPAAL